MAKKINLKNKTRIFIVDDHPIVRHGITQMIDHEEDLMTCGEADGAPQTLKVLDKLKPDITIVDISLEGLSGMELIKNIRARSPKLPLLVFSMHDESLYAERALRAGAKGYIMKQEGTENLITAIRCILEGNIYVSEKLRTKILHKFVNGKYNGNESAVDFLSDRELEVFQLIGQGFGTSQIAAKLFLSVKTIESYRANIKEKLNLKNAPSLVQHAILWHQSHGN